MGISRLKNNKKEVIALFAIGLLFGSSCEGAATKSGLVKKVFCEFYDSNLNDSEGGNAENASDTDVDIAKKMMVCGRESQFCYALWTTSGAGGANSTNNNTANISDIIPQFLKQGCWEASPPSNPIDSSPTTSQSSPQSSSQSVPKNSGYCQRPNCTAYYKKKEGLPVLPPNHMHFCCCQGNYCNADVYLEAIDDDDDEGEDYYETLIPPESLNSKNSMYMAIIIFLVVICTVGLGLVVARVLLGKRLFKNRNGSAAGGPGGDGELDPQEEERLINNDFMNLKRFNKSSPDSFDLKIDLESVLDREIANGRWGRIYSTKKMTNNQHQFLNMNSIALKIYNPDHREFFDNEKFVYECLGQENENILKYYGWTESPTSLVLAFDLVDCNLREFLKTQTFTCHELVDILLGISKGVAYLHNGVSEASTAVAHRDLTSRNILLDMRTKRVCIADFGLSLLTRGSKYYWGGRERQAEFCSLAEAGTLRYLAPELLEGAVNLKDCENALKQADVYSMSLILWEVANSCRDLRISETVDSIEINNMLHALPYDEEAGNKDILNLDDVVRLVVQNRIRPGFHSWSDMGLTRALRDSLNESWDSEPDARLTSLCIVERIQELKMNLNNKFITKSMKALEKKRVVLAEDPAWINRNPTMERNLFDNASGSVTDTNSVVTMATNLSSGGSTDGNHEHKFINNVALLSQQHQPSPLPNSQQLQPQPHFNQQKPIQLIQNISRK
ncbi:activin receptor type-2A isoform X2 [Folsomia candida]|uniref:activin receptor type-2A isoform X2 n=1 Tax=Folsomia candida TaxID=158441 RepID=UPI001604FB82|nr:activin receptor type-2A isoform X2 [Folsomia candida]